MVTWIENIITGIKEWIAKIIDDKSIVISAFINNINIAIDNINIAIDNILATKQDRLTLSEGDGIIITEDSANSYTIDTRIKYSEGKNITFSYNQQTGYTKINANDIFDVYSGNAVNINTHTGLGSNSFSAGQASSTAGLAKHFSWTTENPDIITWDTEIYAAPILGDILIYDEGRVSACVIEVISNRSVRINKPFTNTAVSNVSLSKVWGGAQGEASIALGYYPETFNSYEVGLGAANRSHYVSSTFGNNGNTAFSLGITDGSTHIWNNRKNAIEIMQNGDMYVKGIGNYQGTDTKIQDATVITLQEYLTALETRIAALEAPNT